MFASRSHTEQKQLLGEALYPKIQRQHPELAGKITGMLLEMEHMELLALLDDEPALLAKVDEALSVYDEYVKARKDDDVTGPGSEAATVNDSDKAEAEPTKVE
jgi:polyadenylate-binding protein